MSFAPRFASVRKSELSVITAIDEATSQILGWSADEMLGQRWLEFLHPDDEALAIDNWMRMLAKPGPGAADSPAPARQGRRVDVV